ncbi:MAG TPA: YceI family protein [Patescibacteria group bacterium]|nr:YceI family protein [Patescibacteria group bacterium]
MRQNFLKTTFLAVAFTFTIAACEKAPSGDNAQIGEKQQAAQISGQTFIVDTAASRIRFTGHGIGKNHPGTFKLTNGTVAIQDDAITGGSFTIDIKSMQLEQQEGPIQSQLRPHLMSGDFFDAEKFGTAKFEITGVTPYSPGSSDTSVVEGANFNVSGNFTLKGTTKNITFPARIDLDANTLKARGNFDIDRRQWQMNYGNDKTLGDKFISETVNIELDLRAVKQ